MTEMPRYKSHKVVHALEIGMVSEPDSDTYIGYADAGYGHIVFKVPPEMLARYHPVIGDFHVHYEDGYSSFSPRKAFLEGYTREGS